MAATSCIVRSQRDKFIIALMRVRRGFLPQPPQGAPWRLAAVREDDIAHRRGHGGSSGGRRRAVPSGTGSLIFGGLRQGSIAIVPGALLRVDNY